jgi:GNAT superfamily N-acetyltransferase
MTTSQTEEQPRVPVPLRDGTLAELRLVGPQDRPLLEEGLSQMSMESRFARFGFGISNLSDAELRYLTEIDQVSHVAWGATIDDEPAGVGRYIMGDGSDCAEIAIAVVDHFQRRGLGRALFDALVASARARDIDAFCFSVEPTNRRVLRMIRGAEVKLDDSDGMVVGRIDVGDVGPVKHEAEFVDVLNLYRQGSTTP